MIQFENVTKTYAGGKVKAVDGLDMKIEEGKVFGFIGPNGAGKTTTIKLLTGILSPDSGRVMPQFHGGYLRGGRCKPQAPH